MSRRRNSPSSKERLDENNKRLLLGHDVFESQQAQQADENVTREREEEARRHTIMWCCVIFLMGIVVWGWIHVWRGTFKEIPAATIDPQWEEMRKNVSNFVNDLQQGVNSATELPLDIISPQEEEMLKAAIKQEVEKKQAEEKQSEEETNTSEQVILPEVLETPLTEEIESSTTIPK